VAGKHEAARAHLQEASLLADSLGYQNLSVGLRQNLGFADLLDADPRRARRHFLDSWTQPGSPGSSRMFTPRS
jgi:hypothetical protein